MLTITKKILWNVFAHIYVTINPKFWFSNQRTSNLTDNIINDLIDSGEPPEYCSEYTVRMGNQYVWVANYPYSYGNLYHGKYASDLLPRKVTRLRLRMYLSKLKQKARMEEEKKLLNEYLMEKNK